MAETSNIDKLKHFFDSSKKSTSLPSFNVSSASLVSNVKTAFKSEKDSAPQSSPSYLDCPSLSRKQRAIGFILCFLLGTFCLSIASLYIPFLLLKARKFALLYTLGSLFIIGSFSCLWGPRKHFQHLIAVERLPFTVSYFVTMLGTIYCAAWMKSTFFTVIFASSQLLALVWYFISYVPGGHTGLKFFVNIFTSIASRTVKSTLDV